MDIFGLRDRLVQDYAEYIQSFILIQDPRVGEYVDQELANGLLWPEPLIQMNPSFEPGEWIDDLVQQAILHEECSRIFRIKEDLEEEGKPLRLHRHQAVDFRHLGLDFISLLSHVKGRPLLLKGDVDVEIALRALTQ